MTGNGDQPDLTEAIARLGERIDALHGEVRRAGASSPLPASERLDVAATRHHSWLPYLESRGRRTPRTPRLLLEALFLVGCAIAAGIAELEPAVIAAVMGGAWLLVALLEWAASRADRVRDDLLSIPPPIPASALAAATPVAEQTPARLEETQFVPEEELTGVGGPKLPKARDGELDA
ncbi:MAG: hypothetical protein ACKVUT_18160 [Gaiella sp.]